MPLIQELQKNVTKENTKGGKYYNSTYDANLDVFAGVTRYQDTDDMILKYKKALAENETLALANLLYILDIRDGKGERLIFKTLFKHLCKNNKDAALKILPFISDLGRWDYILVGLDTTIDSEVVELIKKTLESDKNSEIPTLLAKWLPSHRTHNVKNEIAKKLIKKLGITEHEYRKTLTTIREKLHLIENNLTKKEYNTINFEQVPTKAMLKYNSALRYHCKEEYIKYLENVENVQAKINTTGLYSYEIVNNILKGIPVDEKLYNLMWENQRDILKGCDKNILVMADTSASMTNMSNIPLATSIGLAIYIAERNTGEFKDYFMTFSSKPQIQKVIGKNIIEKVQNIECVNQDTDIDEAFKLLLETAYDKNIPQEEMPSHLIIISDMEFDDGVYSKNGTNFNGWKKAFKEKNYELPKIIFWNVRGDTLGYPTTKYEEDVAMISGFSTALLDNIFNLEEITPMKIMMAKLQKYVDMLEVV